MFCLYRVDQASANLEMCVRLHSASRTIASALEEACIEIRAAQHSDFEQIRTLLETNDLPTSDLSEQSLGDFLVAVDSETLVGVVGLERFGGCALLRSLAVRADARTRGLGAELLQAIERYAAEYGVKELYALTLSAEAYLMQRGYEAINRDASPSAIAETTEFQGLCPDTATLLRKTVLPSVSYSPPGQASSPVEFE